MTSWSLQLVAGRAPPAMSILSLVVHDEHVSLVADGRYVRKQSEDGLPRVWADAKAQFSPRGGSIWNVVIPLDSKFEISCGMLVPLMSALLCVLDYRHI